MPTGRVGEDDETAANGGVEAEVAVEWAAAVESSRGGEAGGRAAEGVDKLDAGVAVTDGF